MADIQRSIKDLWVIISGNTNLRSNQLIGIELTKNADQVLNGLLYFTEKRQSKTTVPESFNQELLSKLSTLLGLDKERSYELFCAYLTYEYRGTPDDLKATVASERNIPHILNEVWNYYRMERLFSLFCLRYILEHWQNPSHEYVKLFDGFLERFNEDEIIIKKIIEQLNMIVDTQPPSRESHGPYMTNTLIGQWVNYTLQEQCELLKIVLLYYKDIQPQLENIIQLLDVFQQKHNFGQRSSFRKLLGDSHRSTLDLISYLECLVLVESLDLDWLHRCHLKSMTDHQLLKDSDALQQLDRSMSCLGGNPAHGPLLLSWLLVRSWILPGTGTAGLGKEALRMDAFGYLNDALRHPAFFGDGVLPNKVHAIVYELVFLLVASFNHRSLGPIEPLYRLAVKLLEYPTVAQDFWKEGESSGLGHLLVEAEEMFPLKAEPLLEMLAALARASQHSSSNVISRFRALPCFLEPLDLVPTGVMRIAEDDSRVWLTATRYPYGSRALFIPYETEGIVFKSGDSSFVRWQATVNGWQVIICELFKPCDSDKGWLQRLLHIARLIRSLLEADSSLQDLLANNIDELFAALHRLILLSTPLVSPPIEVLGECLEMVAILAGKDPEKSWKRLVATGLLPALRTKPKSVEELIQGYMVTDNVLSQAMVSQERVVGDHPICLAFLKLLGNVAETFKDTANEDFLACLTVVLQDIFPSFHKWRYNRAYDRDIIGHRCLNIFHKLVTVSTKLKPKTVGSTELCVYGLLHGDSCPALLRLIVSAEEFVSRAVEFEGSRHSKDLLNSVRLCFSLLNRLLLVGAGEGSLLEQRLLVSPSQTAGGAPSLTVSVARFLYLRFDPRLCTLAVQLLKRIAKLYPMSLLACLGRDAESFRDQLLLRLSKDTEDVRLKVALLQLLAVCTRTQPGLFELLLGSTTSSPSSAPSSGSLGDASLSSSGLGLCLGEVLQILKTKQEGKDYCPADLHCSCVEFIHSLWACHQLRAMELLRKSKSFWSMVCFPLMGEAVVTEQSRLVAFIFKTLALELYQSKNELDSNVKSVLNKAKEGAPIKDWSKLVTSSLPKQSGVGNMSLNASAMSIADTTEMFDPITDGYVLLSGWRDLCVILAKCRHVQIAPAEKNAILQDLFSSLVAEGVPANFKISIVLGELYLMLLQHWSSNITSTVAEWMSSLDTVLGILQQGTTSLHPRFALVLSAIGATMVKILKQQMATKKEECKFSVHLWLASLCPLLTFYGRKCAEEGLKSPSSLSAQKMKDSRLSQAICHFFLALTALPQMAEVLQCCGVVDQVSPFLSACYQGTDEGWLSVYRLMVQLVTAMLHGQRHFFLDSALGFMALHVDRLYACLMQVRSNPTQIDEALVTSWLICKVASLRTMYPCDQMNPLMMLMRSICCVLSSAVAYLCRPTLLQHMLEYKKQSAVKPQAGEQASQPKRQLSTDDVADPSPKLTEARKKLLELVFICLCCCKQYSPSVPEALSDQALDIDEWQPIANLSFQSPSVEQDEKLNFGTLMSAAQLCLKSLTKVDRQPLPAGSLRQQRNMEFAILEMSLSITLGQALLYRLHPQVSLHDKQLLSRTYSGEMAAIKAEVQRHLRRGGQGSPSTCRTRTPPLDLVSEWALVQAFIDVVDQVFK
ncbi:nuclear pore complex protein Nup188 isoform X3 [Rhipicephalus microplus]|uniref:nuclear pore complex protein Nup188 isoform X3 n=1 Tax=Rhipicephalus microplus TaxID=6941 RepID=UPI003F6C4C56